MKQSIIIVILWAVTVVRAQDANYSPMLTEGKVWKCVSEWFSTSGLEPDEIPPKDYFTISVCGDTVVNGRLCKRIAYVFDSEPDKISYCAAFEEDKRVYDFDEFGKPNLMLDFSLKTGNLTPLHGKLVISDDTICVRGRSFLRLKIFENPKVSYWIEGIGSDTDRGLLGMRAISGYISRVLSCYENGECIFMQDDFTAEPVNIPSVKRCKIETNGIIYDLSGKIVSMPQKGHIYIQSSKKILW